MIKNFCLISKFEGNKNLNPSSTNSISKLLFNNKESFVIGIIGKPGSGKSVLIQELLLNEELLKGVFEYVLIFSPSKFDYIETIENENWFKFFSLEILYQTIDKLNLIIEKEKQKVKVLYIFDDFITAIKSCKNSPELLKFFYNRRHLLPYKSEISIIISTQRYVVIPINIRSMLSDLIFFRLNDKDYKFIKEDSVGFLKIKQLNNDLLINDHDFLYLSLGEGDGYKNFLTKIN